VRRANGHLPAPAAARGTSPILITGGSGFIGSNLAARFLADGEEVIVLDNLSRAGVAQNLAWLRENHGDRVHLLQADIRDAEAIRPAFTDARAVFHFAAQTAVTTSLAEPIEDFEVNGRGTLNVLEAARRSGRRMPVIFASTNKVYGNLDDLSMVEAGDRYVPADEALRRYGIGETRKLDFCSPYGCSKGVADQYVLDYAKSYRLPTAVLRMSCIYGPRQFGTEDQGWVAHFLIRALRHQAISIFGDGKQVRDILHVDDAVAAYRVVLREIDRVQGRAFNLGGGASNAVSLRGLLREIARITGKDVPISYGEWRRGDQLYFVADTRKLQSTLEWRPMIGWREGLRDLALWLAEYRSSEQAEIPERRITA
jgi:CDP-paratose 2-epimerase